MKTQCEVPTSTAPGAVVAAQRDGVYLDQEAACVRLRWPVGIAEFPHSVAWIEMQWDGWVEASGLMAIAFEEEGARYVGEISLADLKLTPNLAAGLHPEAWSVRDDDLDLIPPPQVDRLLAADYPANSPVPEQLLRLRGDIQRRMLGK